jgi:hypothetical protein
MSENHGIYETNRETSRDANSALIPAKTSRRRNEPA